MLGIKNSIFILIAISCFFLGNWQMDRHDQKQDFIASIKSLSKSAPLKEDALHQHELYSKISITGRFLEKDTKFLYGRRSGASEKDGYYVLTPFESTTGKIYLVSRYWIPQSIKESYFSNHPEQSADIEEIVAVTLPGEKKQFFTPDNDTKNSIWFTIDMEQSKQDLNVNVDGYYLMQLKPLNAPQKAKEFTINNLLKIRNDSLEYSITWYSLALVSIVFLVLNNKSRFSKFQKK
jgi:surfeit locus 1 family protein